MANETKSSNLGGDKLFNILETKLEVLVGIHQTRVDALASSVSEIKDAIKRVEEAVGVVKIVELQASQHGKDFEKLVSTVHTLHSNLTDIQDSLDKTVEIHDEAMTKKIKEVSDGLKTATEFWKEKYNWVRGFIRGLVFSIGILTAVGGVAAWYFKQQIVKYDKMYEFYTVLKLEKDLHSR